MNIIFEAKEVTYNEAIGGDLVQVYFNQEDNDDLLDNPLKYLLLSINYEFPPYEPSIEWYDGDEFNGGGKIIGYNFQIDGLKMQLDNGLRFDISFKFEKVLYNKIHKFISDIYKIFEVKNFPQFRMV